MRKSEAGELCAWLEWLKDEGYCSPSARRNIDFGLAYYRRFC